METESNGDIDSKLIEQFCSMGTEDKEVLIKQFQKIVGNQLNYAYYPFLLEMNNWNLQAAICSYFELEKELPDVDMPQVKVLLAVPQGTDVQKVAPLTSLTCNYTLQNTGSKAWPPGCSLKRVNGQLTSVYDRIMVDSLAPGSTCDVSLVLTAPKDSGFYIESWRLSTMTGLYFGDPIMVNVDVCGPRPVDEEWIQRNGLSSLSLVDQMNPAVRTSHHVTGSQSSPFVTSCSSLTPLMSYSTPVYLPSIGPGPEQDKPGSDLDPVQAACASRSQQHMEFH